MSDTKRSFKDHLAYIPAGLSVLLFHVSFVVLFLDVANIKLASTLFVTSMIMPALLATYFWNKHYKTLNGIFIFTVNSNVF